MIVMWVLGMENRRIRHVSCVATVDTLFMYKRVIYPLIARALIINFVTVEYHAYPLLLFSLNRIYSNVVFHYYQIMAAKLLCTKIC